MDASRGVQVSQNRRIFCRVAKSRRAFYGSAKGDFLTRAAVDAGGLSFVLVVR
jgi:hypothetical protein